MKNKLLTISLLSTMLLGSTTSVFADVNEDLNEATSDILVTFEDMAEPVDPTEPVDPDNPEGPTPVDPTEVGVSLVAVPELYDFHTKLNATGIYELSNELEAETIDVFVANSAQQWQVWARAQVQTNIGGVELTEFNINDKAIVGTGNTNFVFQSTETDGLTGLKKQDVNEVTIAFKDNDYSLTSDSELEAQVEYRLINSIVAE